VKRIVIVGGGVIGLSAAFFCARRGLRVTVVERLPASRDGCSFGNAGMICPSHFVPLAAPGMVALGLKWMWNPKSPFYIKPRLDADLLSWAFKFWRSANAAHVQRSAPLLRDLSLASRAIFAELSQTPGIDFGLVQQGLLMLCKAQHTLDEEAHMAEKARALGIPAEVLSPSQTAQLDPDVTMDIVGSVYFPKDCHLVPHQFMGSLQTEAARAGATFLWNTEVTGWRRDSGGIRAITTSAGEIEGDEFVLCGGSWSPVVSRDLGLRLPMQAGKGYSLTVSQPRQLPRICAIFTEARVAVTPMGSALRFGGTMEIAGLNEDINPLRVQGIVDSAPKYYPAFQPDDFKGIQPWRGLRPVSPDGLPYLGRTRRIPNLTLATGHAMLGLSLAPITGQIVSQVVSQEPSSVPIDLLDPDRHG
jgi:D-amino-acid dehydrogenase